MPSIVGLDFFIYIFKIMLLIVVFNLPLTNTCYLFSRCCTPGGAQERPNHPRMIDVSDSGEGGLLGQMRQFRAMQL